MPNRYCLVRHGATAMQLERRYCGHSDPPLGELGREQILATRAALELPAAATLVCSDLRRATATAQLLRPGAPWTQWPQLRELHFGDWEGLRFDQTGCADADALRALDFRYPGGESARDLFARLREVVPRLRAAAPVVVVAHAGSLAALKLLLLDSAEDKLWTSPWLAPGGHEWIIA